MTRIKQSWLWRVYPWFVLVTSVLGSAWTTLTLIDGIGSVGVHPLSWFFGSLASISISILAWRVINRSARVWEAKLALAFVVGWIAMTIPIYREYTFVENVAAAVARILGFLGIPISLYGVFPAFCLWESRRQGKQVLLK